jgi:hypothetical protein
VNHGGDRRDVLERNRHDRQQHFYSGLEAGVIQPPVLPHAYSHLAPLVGVA